MKTAAFCCGLNHVGGSGEDVSTPLYVEADDFESRVRAAIGRYNEAIEELSARRPDITPASLGEGFTEHGIDLGTAVDRLHEQTLSRLRARVRQFEAMLALASDVSTTDADNASAFGEELPQAVRHG